MAGKNWEKWNPGYVVNWGQVEMIYDPRNVLTLDTIIEQRCKLDSVTFGIKLKLAFSRKWEIAQARPEREGRVVGRWGSIWSTKLGTFSSHTVNQLTFKSWFNDSEKRCCQEWVYAKKISSVWNLTGEKKKKKSLEIEEGGICPSYSVSVFTQSACVSKLGSLKEYQMFFHHSGTLSLIPNQQAVQCNPWP